MGLSGDGSNPAIAVLLDLQLYLAPLKLCFTVTCFLLIWFSFPRAFLEVNQRNEQMRLSVSFRRM